MNKLIDNPPRRTWLAARQAHWPVTRKPITYDPLSLIAFIALYSAPQRHSAVIARRNAHTLKYSRAEYPTAQRRRINLDPAINTWTRLHYYESELKYTHFVYRGISRASTRFNKLVSARYNAECPISLYVFVIPHKLYGETD